MDHKEITKFLLKLEKTKERNIVIIDFANVDGWQNSLGWSVGLKQLGQLVSHLSSGKKYLRRLYYGEDYGPKDKNTTLLPCRQRTDRRQKRQICKGYYFC